MATKKTTTSSKIRLIVKAFEHKLVDDAVSKIIATAKDPQFMADADKTRLEISPMTGEQVAAHFAGYYAAPKPLVERAIKAVRE